MDNIGPNYGPEAEREARRHLEGVERAERLASAEFVAVTVGSEAGDPVIVFIGWGGDLVEQAYPGTAIWQEAVRRFLRSPLTGDAGERMVRAAAAESLERFTSLDRWLSWYDHERQARAERRAQRRERASHGPLYWIGRLW